MTIHTQVQGAGELVFVQRAYYSERVQWHQSKIKLVDGFLLTNEVDNDGNFNQIYFLNFSIPSNKSVKGIISEMFWEKPETTTKTSFVLTLNNLGKKLDRDWSLLWRLEDPKRLPWRAASCNLEQQHSR